MNAAMHSMISGAAPPVASTAVAGIVISGVNIGTVPFSFTAPTLPTITDDVDVSTVGEFNTAVATAGNRINVTAALGSVSINDTTDIEINMSGSGSLGAVTTGDNLARLWLNGGDYNGRLWIGNGTTDVVVQDATITNLSGDTCVNYGLRVAFLECTLNSSAYVIFSNNASVGDAAMVFAGNHFESTGGAQSAIRFVGVDQTITVDNYIENPTHHTYRIHGIASDHYCARNILNGRGTMMGNDSACDSGDPDFDYIQNVWMESNTHYNPDDVFFTQLAEEGLRCGETEGIVFFSAINNTRYADSGSFFFVQYGSYGGDWVDTNNVTLPYEAYSP